MTRKVKMLLGCGGIFAFVSICLCTGCGGLAWRYIDGGVNPFRELKYAVLGESIEIKELHSEHGPQKSLVIDGINHAVQYDKKNINGRDVNIRRFPATYYHPGGPIGLVTHPTDWLPGQLHMYPADARLPSSIVALGGASPWPQLVAAWSEPAIGVVMMNAGTLASYARPLQTIDFYERNPRIVKLSIPVAGEPTFTFIADAKKRGAHVRVFEGDERATFEKQAPQGFYRYLFVETIRGDPNLVVKSVLTREAMQLYVKSLTEDGIVCFHVSNRDFDLNKLVAALAQNQQLAHLVAKDSCNDSFGHFSSEWVFVARDKKSLEPLTNSLPWFGQKHGHEHAKMRGQEFRLFQEQPGMTPIWTDGGSNSLAPWRRK